MQIVIDISEEEYQTYINHTEAILDSSIPLVHQDLLRAVINGTPLSSSDFPNKWIPVNERLPEDGQNVLFSTKTDRVFEGKYYADTSAHNWLSYKDDTYAWNNVVTAWMPLPEPYKASPTGAGSEVQDADSD